MFTHSAGFVFFSWFVFVEIKLLYWKIQMKISIWNCKNILILLHI